MRDSYFRKIGRNNLFDYMNIFGMIIIMIVMVYPLWYSIIGSLNEGMDYMRGGVYLLPRKLTFSNYEAIFYDRSILKAFMVTLGKCTAGTVSSLFLTTLVSYGMLHPRLIGKKLYIPYLMLPMFFGGGLIPYFILIKNMGLYNRFLVYVIPGLFSIWNMIIIQSFMRELPASLFESAKIDGAGEYRIFFNLVLPLSKPVLAAIVLFTFVGHWNSYFDSLMYTSSSDLQTIQLFLKKLITDPSASERMGNTARQVLPEKAVQITPQTMKLAAMTATALPVVCIYPFLQRYFVSGVMIGAIKG